jgi:sn-glycerol 3-phosphate transport system ATP-binding protein
VAEVSIREVCKSFGDREVVHGITCDIADGEFVVIVGPSGCGKSTLLRMVAGLEEITVGEIAIAGRVVNNLEPAERDIAMVFQTYALYPHMTVFDNMAYGLRVRGMARDEIDRRVQEAAGILELSELLKRKPRQLSGGQRQRVAMGRVIVRQPSVFLFDEPLSNLDAKLRVQMRIEIKQLHRTVKTTSIYVTHDQIEAMTLADRLIVMNDGAAEQIGAPLEVYERPATTFVAGFIGSPAMNLFSARLGDRGAVVELPGDQSLALAGDGLPSHAGQPVTLGIRPEHLAVAEQRDSGVEVSVDLVEALGSDTLVHGTLGSDGTALTVRLPGSHVVRAGESLPLSVAPTNLHLFDPERGARLDLG